MSVPGYGSYRDSGVEWVGVFPAHWTTEPLWAVAEECDRPNVGMIESNLLSLSYGRIVQKDINDNDGLLPASFETYQIVEPDDVVWRLTDLQNDKRSLRTARVPERGIITSAYLATRPHRVAPGYFSYLLRAYDLLKVFYSMGGGLRQGMKFSDVRRLPILLPPPPEQAAIAAFLDRETGKIDALVKAQRRLIELLKEKRQSVISHAVTKGLEPAAPMKDSGVEWLGEVPAHWEMRPLKHLGTFNAGAGFPDIEQGFQNEEIAFHKVNALALADAEGFLARGENSVSRDTAKRLGAHIFPARSIVFAKIGAALLLGRLRLLGEPACLDNNLMGLTVNGDHDVDFVRSAMSLVKFDLISNPGTVPSLNKGQIANAPIPVPPYLEQRAISVWLRAAELRLDTLAAAANSTIALLQERRSALISAAVTGKIDVRGFVPEQAEAA